MKSVCDQVVKEGLSHTSKNLTKINIMMPSAYPKIYRWSKIIISACNAQVERICYFYFAELLQDTQKKSNNCSYMAEKQREVNIILKEVGLAGSHKGSD